MVGNGLGAKNGILFKTAAGTEATLNKKQCELRRKLVDQIHARGFEAVVEEVAYTCLLYTSSYEIKVQREWTE